MQGKLLVSLSICVVANTAAADSKPKAPTADEIMQRVEDHSFGKDQTATHTLVILPKGGQKRVRSYALLRKEYSDAVKLVTFFNAPTDVRGAAFMVWDNKKGSDPRWVYLPAVGQVRRLVATDARQSFFGSDFVFEDFTNRDPDQDAHKLVGGQKVDSWDCWVVESTPKDKSGLDFVKYRTWVWKDHDIPVRQETYDASGALVRRVQTIAVSTIDGIDTVTKATVTNAKTGSESRLEVSDVHYNTGIADERFDEAQLQRGAPSTKK